MEGFLGAGYLWVKALHIIFVIFWMAGLFMMPRFFAYHVETLDSKAETARWTERETRLLRIIMNPSMILAWIFGLLLAANLGASLGVWFGVKFAFIILLTGFHMLLARYRRQMANGTIPLSGKAFRLINEVPGVVIILVTLLVVVKPF